MKSTPQIFRLAPTGGDCKEALTFLKRLCLRLRADHQRGRTPLIVVGAGVSTPAAVPLMQDLLAHLEGLATQHRNNDPVVKLCTQARLTRNRSDAAILFGALQNPDTEIERIIWDQFCEDFRRGTIPCNGIIPHESPAPTDTHRWIAQLCIDFGTRCLSLNYDGLTRRAIDEHPAQHERLKAKCVILDTARKIAHFFGRKPSYDPNTALYAIYKLRGDIFNAVCQRSGCPREHQATPVYDLGERAEDQLDVLVQPDTEASAKHFRGSQTSFPLQSTHRFSTDLSCPACGSRRTLQIGFPGHYKKEVESEEILSSLWRYIVPSTSAFILLGFSGEWDRATVEFIFKAARHQHVPVLDVRLEPDEGSTHYLYDVWRSDYADGSIAEYTAFYSTADRFTALVRGMTRAERQLHVSLSGDPTIIENYPVEIPDNLIWNSSNRSRYGSGRLSSLEEFKHLQFASQLGLRACK